MYAKRVQALIKWADTDIIGAETGKMGTYNDTMGKETDKFSLLMSFYTMFEAYSGMPMDSAVPIWRTKPVSSELYFWCRRLSL